MLFDQSFYGDGEGIACVQGDNWKETERNTDSINWENVDFETPSYQSNACCSSVARMGFRGKYASGSHATKSNIHDPFGNLLTQFGVEIACNVDRKSDSGDTCGNGKSWDDFVGTGVCGINDIYTSENENKVTAWATANGVTIERHPTYVVFECEARDSPPKLIKYQNANRITHSHARSNNRSECQSYHTLTRSLEQQILLSGKSNCCV